MSAPPARVAALTSLDDLVSCVNSICAEKRWFRTVHFRPSVRWRHAARVPVCECHWLRVALAGEQVVAYCRLFSQPERLPGWVELGIGVRSGFRRRGLGAQLMSEALAWADAQKAAGVYLHTFRHNHAAQQLFLKFGFHFIPEPTPAWAGAIAPAEGEWLMTKPLGLAGGLRPSHRDTLCGYPLC